MRKVAVIGCPGSGKSTLARSLAETTHLPVIFLDEIYHDPKRWSVDSSKKETEWREYQEEQVRQPQWIIDGNYKCTLEIRIAAADTIIFLDYPRWLCFLRVIKRSLGWHLNGWTAGANPGTLDWKFLKFIWDYWRVERP